MEARLGKQSVKLNRSYLFKKLDFQFWSDTNSAAKIWYLANFYQMVRNLDFKDIYMMTLFCAACHKTQSNWPNEKLKVCKGCQLVYYCCKKCQKYDWIRNEHRTICSSLSKLYSIV